LLVVDETTGDTIIYNVRFVNDSAVIVYSDTFIFDFTAPEDDETIFVALEAVMDALNAEVPIPPGASSQGTDQFFIGYKVKNGIVAVGGENIEGVWDQCVTDCTAGVALLSFTDEEVTWADFQEVVAPGVVQVFRTSETYTGDFGGLAGGDAICQERAEAKGLNGTWTAWLSDDNADAIDRIPDGEYQLVDGTVIADDKADLTDGTLKAPINLDEFGFPDGIQVWTGTDAEGTGTDENCNNWTVSVGDADADSGWSTEINSSWTKRDLPISCTGGAKSSLYCFGGGQ